jgi:hypothetical protein
MDIVPVPIRLQTPLLALVLRPVVAPCTVVFQIVYQKRSFLPPLITHYCTKIIHILAMSDPLSPTELQEILAFTTELARKAGELMLEGSHAIQRAGAGGVGEKKNAVDLVTEYDVKVEELVRNEIARIYPHFQL